LTDFSCGSWDTQFKEESGSSTLQGEMGAIFFLCLYVCVAPLWLTGIRGKKSTPSVDWEVSVRYSLLESGELDGAQERKNVFDFIAFDYGTNH